MKDVLFFCVRHGQRDEVHSLLATAFPERTIYIFPEGIRSVTITRIDTVLVVDSLDILASQLDRVAQEIRAVTSLRVVVTRGSFSYIPIIEESTGSIDEQALV